MSNLKIVKFLDKKWQEIPDLDNPAMACNMFKDPNNFGALVHPECLMIFQGTREAYQITNGGYVVIRVPKEGDIILLGVFWSAGVAEIFANVAAICVGDEALRVMPSDNAKEGE